MRHPVIVTLGLLGLLIFGQAVQGAPTSSAFSGTWTAQDPLPPAGDGSINHLVVSRGANPRIDFQDEFGTVCWDNGATDFWFSSSLRGTVNGNTMVGTFRSAKCGHLSLDVLRGTTHTWTLDAKGNNDPSDDTLWDGFVTFHRV